MTRDPRASLADADADADADARLGDHPLSGKDLSVALNQVRASGVLLQVTFTVKNANEEDQAVHGMFDADGPGVQRDVDAVVVLDPTNAKRYPVARTKDGKCVCSDGIPAYIDASGQMVLTATFTAPPADVSAVDVVVPGAAPFAGVQIQR